MKTIKLINNQNRPVQASPVTMEEWNDTHPDYKAVINGVKYMLFNDNGKTVSRPVYFDKDALLSYCPIDRLFTWEMVRDGSLFKSRSFTTRDKAHKAMRAGVDMYEAKERGPRRVLTVSSSDI